MGNHKNNYVIVCESRTGSTMLSTALWSHPEVCMHGELLQDRQFPNIKHTEADDVLEFFGLDYNNPGPIIDLLRDELISSPVTYIKKYGFYVGRFKKVGFKCKYEEMSHPLFKDVPEFLGRHKGIKIIHLKRKDLWKRYRSSYIALNVTHEFNSVDERISIDSNRRVVLDVKDIEQSFNKSIDWQTHYDKLFSNHAVLNITYEDILRNKQLSYDRVTNFLGVSNVKWEPWTKKVRSVDDETLVKNMNEIRQYFSETKYGNFFKEGLT